MPDIDLNCDMGEGMGNDHLIMPFISSANIACGYHAGDEKTIFETIELAIKYKVAIGAHVSFHDKAHFGRLEMNLPVQEVYELVIQQLIVLNEIAEYFETSLHHVKPHGALYNMAAKDPKMANAIAEATRDYDDTLVIYGLSGSHLVSSAAGMGLKTANEVFADRAYQDDGHLVPRNQPGAVIEDSSLALNQAMQMIREGTVTSLSGKLIPIVADTICIHGDGKHAVLFAKSIHDTVSAEGIRIAQPGSLTK